MFRQGAGSIASYESSDDGYDPSVGPWGIQVAFPKTRQPGSAAATLI
jgi:hypothetical protein